MSHCGYLASLPDHTLQAAWFSGRYETSDDMVILTARKKLSEPIWSKPEILTSFPGHAVGQPVLFPRPDDSLWLFFVVIIDKKDQKSGEDRPFNALPPRAGWSAAQPFIKISFDKGRTWEIPEQIMDYSGLMFRGRPLAIRERIILPAYDENTWESKMLISDDDGQSWRLTDPIQTPPGNIHATLVKLPGDRILAYLRPGGKGGVIWRTQSHDLGETWEVPVPTQIPNPNSGFDLVRLKSGNLLLAFNDSVSERTPLCVFLGDGKERWFCKRILESGPGEFSYPSLLQTKDDAIHIVYTYQRKHIHYATFSEEWMNSKFEGRTN
jgi:predicted neuraminidase